MPENTIGQRVKKQRIKKGLTIKEVSKLISTSSNAILNIEKERVLNPTIKVVRNLSKALDVSISYLLDADNIPENTTAEIIKKYRLLSGLTQKELALKCDLKSASISDYENGRCNGTHAKKTLSRIYHEIGCKN